MTDSPASTTPTPQPIAPAPATASSAGGPVIIRSWPKIVMMLPTFFASLVCGFLMALYPDTAAAAGAFSRVHYVGLFFLLILAINLTLLLYDLSLRGFIIVALMITTLLLGLFLLSDRTQGVWSTIGRTLSVRVWANAAFYFMFSLVLAFNLAIAWVITRFNYWKVENNEIIIHSGFMHEQERHPTAQARFKLVIEDIIEYGLMGSGKLVFYFGDNNTEHELTTVLRVHRKAKQLDELLGRVAVIER